MTSTLENKRGSNSRHTQPVAAVPAIYDVFFASCLIEVAATDEPAPPPVELCTSSLADPSSVICSTTGKTVAVTVSFSYVDIAATARRRHEPSHHQEPATPPTQSSHHQQPAPPPAGPTRSSAATSSVGHGLN
ncbi:RING/U-box superfamily protein [Striga asiatica]|uniref:RING/U-box superfamily protein n=1 Tax=Striga asiatica TaxID=4170 RepID=A0A5A7P459_STRAF|nr:RING/U-box superfamily protein [Striga asiatica]